MEWIIFLIVGSFLVSFISDKVSKNESEFTNKNKLNSKDEINKENLELLKSIKLDEISKNDTIEAEIIEEKENRQTVINNHYTQNVYVQQNNYYNKSKDENKDHSKKVWKRLGYRVKYGERYSYKFYGNEIYTPQQVEKISSYHVKYSEKGLTNKILKDTGSKQHTIKILVDNYGISENRAKSLVGYQKKLKY